MDPDQLLSVYKQVRDLATAVKLYKSSGLAERDVPGPGSFLPENLQILQNRFTATHVTPPEARQSLSLLSRIDPANPYYYWLQNQNSITYDQFTEALQRFANDPIRFPALEDAIRNLEEHGEVTYVLEENGPKIPAPEALSVKPPETETADLNPNQPENPPALPTPSSVTPSVPSVPSVQVNAPPLRPAAQAEQARPQVSVKSEETLNAMQKAKANQLSRSPNSSSGPPPVARAPRPINPLPQRRPASAKPSIKLSRRPTDLPRPAFRPEPRATPSAPRQNFARTTTRSFSPFRSLRRFARNPALSLGVELGTFAQRATRVVLPREIRSVGGGFMRGISQMLGSGARGSSFFISNSGRGRSLRNSLGGIGGGGGRRGFVSRVSSSGPGGKKKWLLWLLIIFFGAGILAGLFPLSNPKQTTGGTNRVDIQKTGPTAVKNGENITYKITVTNTGTSPADITVTDPFPQDTIYADSDPKATIEGKIAKWSLSQVPANSPRVLSLTVTPQKNDFWAVNEATALSSGGGGSVIGGSCPNLEAIDNNRKKGKTCSYLGPNVDIFNTAVNPQKVDAYIEKYAGQYKGTKDQFRASVDLIIKKSQQRGLNPAIFLGYWKAESGFGNNFGCDPTGPSLPLEQELNCALGLKTDGSIPADGDSKGSMGPRCALSKDANSWACKQVKGIRDAHPDVYDGYPVSLPIATFDNLFEIHGSISPRLKDNIDDARTNCNSYNNTLQIIMELVDCNVTTSSTLSISSASCPIPNGKISCGSYEGVPGKVAACHCTPSYAAANPALCGGLVVNGNLKRTAKSIDIMPAGRDGQPGDRIFLPSVSGAKLTWHYKGLVVDKNGYGNLRLFQSDPTSEGVWSLYMVHVDADKPPLSKDTAYSSGDYVAEIGPGQNHVHINIGTNIANFGGDDFNDPGWKFPDKDMGICVNPEAS